MDRRITGFHRDDAGDPVATLECGHGQHVRHDPPWHERPWVESAEERSARLGTTLDCLRCDRRELPEHFVATRRTPSFDAESIPPGLQRAHTTRAGVWARIQVTSGALDYRIFAPFDETLRLVPGEDGIVLPGVEHEVAACGDVAFHVQFYAEEKT